jgi:hypothetical protein
LGVFESLKAMFIDRWLDLRKVLREIFGGDRS